MRAARRAGVLIVLIVLIGQIRTTGQENPLAGHQVEAKMPDAVFVFTDGRAGVTWTGPMILEIDGTPAARITLPPASADLPRTRWTWREWMALAGSAVGGGLLTAAILR